MPWRAAAATHLKAHRTFTSREGQRSGFKGVDVLLRDLPKIETHIGDRECDSTKIRSMPDAGHDAMRSAEEKP